MAGGVCTMESNRQTTTKIASPAATIISDTPFLLIGQQLAGAFLGAKLVYLGAEGWLHWHDPNRWVILATGKSITGALLGGYLGVEIAKKLLKYNGMNGEWYAPPGP